MAESSLISEEYRSMQRELHRNPDYGVASLEYAPVVRQLMQMHKITEFLDYGAGKGRLGMALEDESDDPLTIHHYEPAIPEWSAPPEPCGFVTCIDVLEHIEPHLLDNVLADLQRVTLKWGFFSVHTSAALKVLPDGRNAHLIQQSASWWLPKLMERFELNMFSKSRGGFYVLVERKPDSR